MAECMQLFSCSLEDLTCAFVSRKKVWQDLQTAGRDFDNLLQSERIREKTVVVVVKRLYRLRDACVSISSGDCRL